MYRKIRLTHFSKQLILGFTLSFSVFLAKGLSLEASEKETPLVNLASGITDVIDNNGRALTNPEYLTDGDKYYLQHNENGNKTNGAWETYQEKGAVAHGQWVWIQLDLGASYPIEVINLKRQVYQGQTSNSSGDNSRIQGSKITYQNTAIVIGNEENLSDGEVIYYQGTFALPDGVERPSVTSDLYQESMGGQWFYMDYNKEKGLGQTELGTVKNARYVRVYTYNPHGDTVNFMELGVYGYRDTSNIQTPSKRRVIDNNNPLMIATAYSDDVYAIGQREEGKEPTLQGYNTVSGRCNAIPASLKDNTTMLLHTNNLRQFSPEHIGQANIQAFFEHGLQACYENNTSAMLLGISASATPGGAHWYPIRDMDYGWLDLMYRMYPNMQGTLNTENYWSGAAGAVATNSAKQLELAHRYGGYFIWADQDHGGYVETAFNNATWKEALKKYGQSCFMLYKNTGAGADDLESSSYHQGHWLAGYTGGWGMLSDTWFWDSKKQGKLYSTGNQYNNWQRLCGVPEALMGSQMISTYLEGGVIYTFEFPEIVYGSNNTNSPTFHHVIEKLFTYFKENPAPSKGDILAKTKVMVYGGLGSKDVYSGTIGNQTGINVYGTGRYGILPVVLGVDSYENTLSRIRQEASNAGVSAPELLQVNDERLNGQTRIDYFNGLYPETYQGTAFADHYNNVWFVYNNILNTNTTQNAVLSLNQEGASLEAILEPHSYLMMEENETVIDLLVNNYRVNKDSLVFDNTMGGTWTGSFAPGQPVINGKKSVYDFMTYWNVVNADPSRNEHSPEDNTLRNTVIKITNLAQAPSVLVTDVQQPDTDGLPQYSQPTVSYDEASNTATITIISNGWGKYQISDLVYTTEETVDPIEPVEPSEEPEVIQAENVAPDSDILTSAATSSNRASHAVDLNLEEPNYSDPGGNDGGAHWLQLDLGEEKSIEEVHLYRYWEDGRTYNDTVILLSTNENFIPEETLVLWNANTSDETTWPGTGNGASDGHTLPVGNDEAYAETADGLTISLSQKDLSWLDGNTEREISLNEDGFTARYVRVYMNGNSVNNCNHIKEITVIAK